MDGNLPELNRRVYALIEHFTKGNVKAFAQKMKNVSQQRLDRIFKIDTRTNKFPSVPDDILTGISLVFDTVNTKWLLTGAGDMLKEQSDLNQGVPYWDLPVSAGRSVRDVIGASKPDGFISGLPGADIAENILPVTGTSMEPEISPGAIIGVRLMNNYDTLNTERIYLIITTDDRMIKRIEHDSENEDILWCVSPNYPRFKIYKSDVVEIQRVCFVYNPK